MTDTTQSTEGTDIPARIVRQISVLGTTNPQVAILKMKTAQGEEHFAMTREALIDLGNLLLKNAQRFEPSKKDANETAN